MLAQLPPVPCPSGSIDPAPFFTEVLRDRTRHPLGPAPDRRPFRVGAVEGPIRTGGAARGPSFRVPRDEPPPGTGSRGRRADPHRTGAACSRCRTDTRWRSATAGRRRSGMRRRSASSSTEPAPVASGSSRPSSPSARGQPPSSMTRRSSPPSPEPTRSRSPTRPSIPTALPTTRPRRECRRPCGDLAGTDGSEAHGLVLVDGTSAAGGLRVEPAEFDAYYFAPQKCFGSEGGLWLALLSPAAIERIERLAASGPLRARLLGPQDRPRELPAPADLQHSLACDAAAAGRAGRLVPGPRRPRVGRLPCGPLSGDRLQLGRGFELRPALRRAWPSAAMSPRRSTSRTASTRSRWRRCSRANGVVDTEPYRKLGRNQLRIALFPGIEPGDVQALTACVDWVVERVGS